MERTIYVIKGSEVVVNKGICSEWMEDIFTNKQIARDAFGDLQVSLNGIARVGGNEFYVNSTTNTFMEYSLFDIEIVIL